MQDGYTETPIFTGDDSKLIVKRTYDNAPVLEKAAQLRDAGATDLGDSKLVGHIPMYMVTQWMKEAGVAHDDNEARKDILKKKLMSGEFDKLRIWKGTW
jgi:hypothetical protein